MSFGLGSNADVYAENITYLGANSQFDIMYKGEKFTDVTLHVPGVHNVKNAIAAASAALVLGISGEAIARGLGDYRGAGRRFEYKGKVKGAAVYDDYAHHPGELTALLDMAMSLDYKRVICAFQPHTYTRTKALFNEFASVLKRPDVTFLAEIYAAREKNDVGISSQDLADAIPGALVAPSFAELTNWLYRIARPGDLILTVGAGNIFTVGEALVRMGQQEEQ